MDILPTTRFNFLSSKALLNTDSLAIAILDHSFNIKELNNRFSALLKLSSIRENIHDLHLFDEGEMKVIAEKFIDDRVKELLFKKQVSCEDGFSKTLSIKLSGLYEEQSFSGLVIILEDITRKEASQRALAAVANNYSQNDIKSFFQNISKELIDIFNISTVIISSYNEKSKKELIQFIRIKEDIIDSKGSIHLSTEDYQFENEEKFQELFFQISSEDLNQINGLLKLNLTQTQGIILKNREGETTGSLILASCKNQLKTELSFDILPIFSNKIAYEIAHFNSLKKEQENEAFFKKLYKESPLGIIMISPKTAKIFKANSRICDLLGYSEEEMKEKTMYQITHQADQHLHKQKYKASLINAKGVFKFEKRLLKKNGDSIWFRIEVSIIKDNLGNPLYDFATLADISESKKARDLINSQIEILNIQNRKLEKYIESNLELENFAYIASHDLKAPLRTIGNFAQLLRRRLKLNISEEEMEYLHFIIEGVKDMNCLIEDLLLYSKVNSSENLIEKIDVQHVVDNVLRNLNATIQENQAHIVVENLPKHIIANKTKLTQLLQNLIANGIKFQKVENIPEIYLKAKEKEKCWQFEVSDNGIGIEKVYHGKIFNLFKRLHGKGEYEGTGIGLAYCKRVVEKHGGDIWLESEIGKGTNFFFTIMKQNGF